jgi:hypothetical protein
VPGYDRLSLWDKSHPAIEDSHDMKLAFMPLRPGLGSVAVGAENRRTEHRPDACYHCLGVMPPEGRRPSGCITFSKCPNSSAPKGLKNLAQGLTLGSTLGYAFRTLRAADRALNTYKSPAYFLVVPPGHTGTASPEEEKLARSPDRLGA